MYSIPQSNRKLRQRPSWKDDGIGDSMSPNLDMKQVLPSTINALKDDKMSVGIFQHASRVPRSVKKPKLKQPLSPDILLPSSHSPAIGNSLNASFEKIPPSPAAPFYIGPFSPSLGSSHYNLISPYKHAQTGSVDFQWDLAAPVLSSDALMDNTDKLQLQLSSMELCEENALRRRAVSGSVTPRININSIGPGPTAAGFVFATPAPLTYTRSISDSNVPTSTISIGSTTASLDSRSSVHSRVLSSGGWQATSGDKHRNPSLLMCTPASVVTNAPGLRISNVDRELRVLGDLGLAPALSSSCLIFGSPPPMATSTAATVLSSMVRTNRDCSSGASSPPNPTHVLARHVPGGCLRAVSNSCGLQSIRARRMGSLSGCNPDAIDTSSRAVSIASIRVQLPGTPRISSASILPLSSPGSSMMSPPTPGQLFSLTVHSPAFTANMNFNKMTGVRFRTNIGPNGNGQLSAWDVAAQLPVGLRTRVPPCTVVATRGFSQCSLPNTLTEHPILPRSSAMRNLVQAATPTQANNFSHLRTPIKSVMPPQEHVHHATVHPLQRPFVPVNKLGAKPVSITHTLFPASPLKRVPIATTPGVKPSPSPLSQFQKQLSRFVPKSGHCLQPSPPTSYGLASTNTVSNLTFNSLLSPHINTGPATLTGADTGSCMSMVSSSGNSVANSSAESLTMIVPYGQQAHNRSKSIGAALVRARSDSNNFPITMDLDLSAITPRTSQISAVAGSVGSFSTGSRALAITSMSGSRFGSIFVRDRASSINVSISPPPIALQSSGAATLWSTMTSPTPYIAANALDFVSAPCTPCASPSDSIFSAFAQTDCLVQLQTSTTSPAPYGKHAINSPAQRHASEHIKLGPGLGLTNALLQLDSPPPRSTPSRFSSPHHETSSPLVLGLYKPLSSIMEPKDDRFFSDKTTSKIQVMDESPSTSRNRVSCPDVSSEGWITKPPAGLLRQDVANSVITAGAVTMLSPMTKSKHSDASQLLRVPGLMGFSAIPAPDQSIFDRSQTRRMKHAPAPLTPERPQARLNRRSSLLETKLLFSTGKAMHTPVLFNAQSPTINTTSDSDITRHSIISCSGGIFSSGTPVIGSASAIVARSPIATGGITYMDLSVSSSGSGEGASFSLDDFEDMRHVGEGSFFTVFSARSRRTGEIYAIKKSKRQFRSRNDRKNYLSEVESINEIGSNNVHIIKIYNCWQEDGHFFIQMEFCPMSLMDLMRRTIYLDEPFVWCALYQVCLGLVQVHANHVVHMDLKPDNILVDYDNNLKIGDFGSAILKGKKAADAAESDSAYIAPEIFINEQNGTAPDPSADVFSLGLMCFEMVTCFELPLNGQTWHYLRKNGGRSFLHTKISQQLEDILMRMFSQTPSLRPTANELLKICEEKFASGAPAADLLMQGSIVVDKL